MKIYAFAFQSVDEEASAIGGIEWNPSWEMLRIQFIAIARNCHADTEFLYFVLEVPEDLVPQDITAATFEERDAITDWVDATVGEFPVNYAVRLVVPGRASLWDHELQRIRGALDPSSPNGEDTPPPIPAPSMPLGTNLTPRS